MLYSLELFSVYGYDGTGIRQIAKGVGIKDSSLYKHYQSKDDIINHIYEYVTDYINIHYQSNKIPNPLQAKEVYQHIRLDQLIEIAIQLYTFYTEDELVVKFKQMLTIEQFKDNRASKLYHLLYIQGAIEYEQAIFESLLENGVLKNGDSTLMAYEFYSVLFFLMSGTHSSAFDPKTLIKYHVTSFWNKYHEEN